MKLVHVADLHLGKRLNEFSLLEDQILLLKQIQEIALREAADAVLIAGDVYQKASPSAEAMTALNDFISALVEKDIRVFLISGNHDSDQRIDYMASLLCRAGVYTCGVYDGTIPFYQLEDEFGPVRIHLLPFIKPAHVRRFFPEEEIDNSQQAVKAALSRAKLLKEGRNVLLAHQFISGAQTSDSEEISVGTLDSVDARLMDGFNYVALGHLHRPQQILRPSLRYAGSPMKYSFSEVNDKKSVAVITLGAPGQVDLSLEPLNPPHDLREVEGSMEALLAMEYSEDYCKVTVRDEQIPPDARITLSTIFPNMMRFVVENARTRMEMELTPRSQVETLTPGQLFSDFYRLQNDGADPEPDQLALLERILKEVETEDEAD